MVEVEEAIEIGAPPEAVFGVLHDFGQRLAWDRSMSGARLKNAEFAEVGAQTQCITTWALARTEVSFEYLELEEGVLAVLEMVKRPWPIRKMAATIQHRACGNGRSRVSYRFKLAIGPQIAESIFGVFMRWQTRKRLRALKHYVEGI
jgi:hypothetical protein